MTMGTPAEIRALAVVAASLKRRTRPYDLLTIARAAKTLIDLHGLGRAAQLADVTPGMLRQFAVLLDLPPEVQELLSERKIDHVTAASLLARLHRHDDQVLLGRLLATQRLTREEVQDIIQYLNRNPKKTLDAAVEEVLATRAPPERVYVIVMARPTRPDQAMNRLRSLGAREIHDQGGHLVIIADQKGKESLDAEARRRRVPLTALSENLGGTGSGA